MRFRNGVLVALVLASALAVVVSPAFATPNITASSGTRSADIQRAGAVTPFITPSTNTRSEYSGVAPGTRPSLTVPAVGAVECDTSNVSGYASTTHTQIRITSVTFSRNCRVADRPGGSRIGKSLDTPNISCAVDSFTPWFVHVRDVRANSSSSGTVNLVPSSMGGGRVEVCTVRITVGGSIVISVDPNQSCRKRGSGRTLHMVQIPRAVRCDMSCESNNSSRR